MNIMQIGKIISITRYNCPYYYKIIMMPPPINVKIDDIKTLIGNMS